MISFSAYKGNGKDGRAALPGFEAWLGRKVDFLTDFIDFNSRADFDSDVQWALGYWAGEPRPMCLAVPTLCKGETFTTITSGSVDDSYRKLAAKAKAGAVWIKWARLGWEDDLQTTPGYASQDAGAGFANYKASRRHLYALLKSLDWGAHGPPMILLDKATGWNQVELSAIWDPQSADGLGLTAYPQGWDGITTEPAFTDKLMTRSWGLAGYHDWPGVPILVTEWSCGGVRDDGHGAPYGGDDPEWARRSLALFESWGDRCMGVSQWDNGAGGFNGYVSGGAFPNAGAVLKTHFAPVATAVPTAPTPAPALKATFAAVASDGATVALTPTADGGGVLVVTFPKTANSRHYTIWLKDLVGPPLTRHVENWGPMSQIGWDTVGGTATIHVGAS